jgi:hypothetical protein
MVEAARLNLSSFTIQRYEKKRCETILSPRFFSEIYKKNRNAAYATVPLCHCVTASQCSPILFVVFFVVSELLFTFADRNQNVFLFLFVFFDYSE